MLSWEHPVHDGTVQNPRLSAMHHAPQLIPSQETFGHTAASFDLWADAALSGTATLEQARQLISYEKESEKFKGDNLFLKLQVSLVPDHFYYPKRKC